MLTNPLFHRLHLLTGESAMEQLHKTRVAVFGIGGVGSWAVEALVRSGVQNMTIVDHDEVNITNVNRQLQATPATVGQPKVEALKSRLETLNPEIKVETVPMMFGPANSDKFDLSRFDYVLDCIDSLACKTELIVRTHRAGTTLFSAMGAACKLDPTKIRMDSIWKTQGCPLARIVRKNLRAAGFEGDFQAVFSAEVIAPTEPRAREILEDGSTKKVNGSAMHITATFGMFLAGLVIQDVIRISSS